MHNLGTRVITALPLQVLLFYGEGPATIKLVDNRSPLESGEFLQALVVESRHPRRILLVLLAWVRPSRETKENVTYLDLLESVLSTPEKVFSEIVGAERLGRLQRGCIKL